VEFARGLALAADSTVVVQTPGIYRCVGLVQLIDDQAAGISWGLGVGTANEDTGDFTFTQTVSSLGTARNSHDAEAELELATGEAVRLYAWCSHPGVPVRKAKLSIERIR